MVLGRLVFDLPEVQCSRQGSLRSRRYSFWPGVLVEVEVGGVAPATAQPRRRRNRFDLRRDKASRQR